jgi:hypothetical protein
MTLSSRQTIYDVFFVLRKNAGLALYDGRLLRQQSQYKHVDSTKQQEVSVWSWVWPDRVW